MQKACKLEPILVKTELSACLASGVRRGSSANLSVTSTRSRENTPPLALVVTQQFWLENRQLYGYT